MRLLMLFSLLLVLALAPHGVSAHEVYVLSPQTIAHDLSTPSPNPFDAFFTNETQFFFWGFLAFIFVTTVFLASITHRLERLLGPYLTLLRKWAPLVARVTLGLSLIFSAQHHDLFGSELSIAQIDTFGLLVYWGLWLSGVCILLGLFTRLSGLLALVIFACGVWHWGAYMLNYANYFGEMTAVFFLGGGLMSVDSLFVRHRLDKRLEGYAFLLLRVGFGTAIVFASLYAKFIHSNLALSVVSQYHLTDYFHFDPLFIVLGACIIEVMMGVFFIIGFEVRHTAAFFLFWLCLSLLFFGEAVWPHTLLFGVNAALFMYGYDRWSIEGRFFNRGKLQPVL